MKNWRGMIHSFLHLHLSDQSLTTRSPPARKETRNRLESPERHSETKNVSKPSQKRKKMSSDSPSNAQFRKAYMDDIDMLLEEDGSSSSSEKQDHQKQKLRHGHTKDKSHSPRRDRSRSHSPRSTRRSHEHRRSRSPQRSQTRSDEHRNERRISRRSSKSHSGDHRSSGYDSRNDASSKDASQLKNENENWFAKFLQETSHKKSSEKSSKTSRSPKRSSDRLKDRITDSRKADGSSSAFSNSATPQFNEKPKKKTSNPEDDYDPFGDTEEYSYDKHQKSQEPNQQHSESSELNVSMGEELEGNNSSSSNDHKEQAAESQVNTKLQPDETTSEIISKLASPDEGLVSSKHENHTEADAVDASVLPQPISKQLDVIVPEASKLKGAECGVQLVGTKDAASNDSTEKRESAYAQEIHSESEKFEKEAPTKEKDKGEHMSLQKKLSSGSDSLSISSDTMAPGSPMEELVSTAFTQNLSKNEAKKPKPEIKIKLDSIEMRTPTSSRSNSLTPKSSRRFSPQRQSTRTTSHQERGHRYWYQERVDTNSSEKIEESDEVYETSTIRHSLPGTHINQRNYDDLYRSCMKIYRDMQRQRLDVDWIDKVLTKAHSEMDTLTKAEADRIFEMCRDVVNAMYEQSKAAASTPVVSQVEASNSGQSQVPARGQVTQTMYSSPSQPQLTFPPNIPTNPNAFSTPQQPSQVQAQMIHPQDQMSPKRPINRVLFSPSQSSSQNTQFGLQTPQQVPTQIQPQMHQQTQVHVMPQQEVQQMSHHLPVPQVSVQQQHTETLPEIQLPQPQLNDSLSPSDKQASGHRLPQRAKSPGTKFQYKPRGTVKSPKSSASSAAPTASQKEDKDNKKTKKSSKEKKHSKSKKAHSSPNKKSHKMKIKFPGEKPKDEIAALVKSFSAMKAVRNDRANFKLICKKVIDKVYDNYKEKKNTDPTMSLGKYMSKKRCDKIHILAQKYVDKLVKK